MTEDVKEKNEAVDEERSELAELRVRSNSPVKPLAGSITATMKQYGHVSLRCIGDGAIGRAVRGATIASGYLKPIGINLKMTSSSVFWVLKLPRYPNSNCVFSSMGQT